MNVTVLLRRIFITACMVTRTTGLAARQLGAGFFLPALFVKRYSAMGMLDETVFARQLDSVRSFDDEAWCSHWNASAEVELARAEEAVAGIAGSCAPPQLRKEGAQRVATAALHQLVAASVPSIIELLCGDTAPADPSVGPRGGTGVPIDPVAAALLHLVKAITYYQVSAFPGGSVARMEAYRRSRQLFDRLLEVLGTTLDVSVERRRIVVGDEVVDGYLILPAGAQVSPAVILTNGLEGTVQELVLPLLRYRHSGLAVFVMEMPGTYSYRKPMSGASEDIYHKVIDDVASHPRVDANRIGFVGVSFGGYWAARLAFASQRLRCVVACGAPTHHSFLPARSLGIPEIIVKALLDVTGAGNLHRLGKALKALSIRDAYARIRTPLLVINGENDTLLSTQDSIDLAAGAVNGRLVLYSGDDHCAMGHYREWLDMSQEWLRQHLLGPADDAHRGDQPSARCAPSN